ncbi:MAG: polyphosphate:AMP phosphotransferase [Nitrospinota bacterium]|nr:polyphosphate:AMP phosphotransferase [Nitrospinota bacterium]
MFETAEIGAMVEKDIYEKEAIAVREQLLAAQRKLITSKIPVIILVSGNEGAGKGELVNLLNEWMDARLIQTHAMWDPSDEERERPRFWRFWRQLPPKGKMGIFFGSWYSNPIIDRVYKKISQEEYVNELKRIRGFERMLDNEGAIILKFWLHLSKKAQSQRLKDLQADPNTAWKVTSLDWKFFKKYDRFRKVSEQALRETSTGEAPWHIIEAVDKRYRQLTVTKMILGAILERTKRKTEGRAADHPAPALPKPKKVNVINQLDLTKSLSQKEYDDTLLKLQGKLNLLARKLYQKKHSMVLVFEGNDAAGKGGSIRRVITGVDARGYQIVQVAAPTEDERNQPYLWRFWRHIPRLGKIVIFDRSWYGRVLVERIEGFCQETDWQRAYTEINDFEDQMTDHGIIVLKFWLSISADEQLRRFKERETTSYKKYKITDEDWRNREKWEAYEAAVCDMVEKTSTRRAPWILVESNDKKFGRIKILKTIISRLQKRLD